MVLTALVDPIHADVMLEPGARMSTALPKLEYEANPSLLVVAPTVTALAAEAGETCVCGETCLLRQKEGRLNLGGGGEMGGDGRRDVGWACVRVSYVGNVLCLVSGGNN